MDASNYNALIERLKSIHYSPLGINNHYGDFMVRESGDSFIGNSTLLEALLNEYTKSFREYSSEGVKVTLTSKQHAALKEISLALEDEFCVMAFGAEAVANLLAKCDNKNGGLDSDQISHLNLLIAFLAKSLHNHRDLMAALSDDLAGCSVIY